ncbi:hypothetical protein AL538_28305 [Vibrio harveyi]|uniref:Uncharacterized protein n=1 Tax=Vibrio harveyi TaxID=669 RepID=A0ABM6RMH3_VIBHA|nr:hypothetical protein AL538_28305 [Vibrio harveyi]
MGSQPKATFVSYEQQITSFDLVFTSLHCVYTLRNLNCFFNLDISLTSLLIKLTQQRFKRYPSSKQNVKFKVLFGIKQVFDFLV